MNGANFYDKLSKSSNELSQFCQKLARELAARLLSLVIPRTPVGESTTYLDKDGKRQVMKNGGTLRRGWVAKTEEECLDLAKISAEVTHNHPEGIKGVDIPLAARISLKFSKSDEEIFSSKILQPSPITT